MNPSRRSQKPRHQARENSASAGFSIVEAVIMAALLSIGAITSLTLFTFTSRQQRQTGEIQQVQEAVAGDIASIERFNERIVCTGTDGACTVSNSDPGESGYSRSDYLPGATINLFRDRCRGVNDQTLGTVAAALLPNSVPVPSSFSTLGITRLATASGVTSAGDSPNHQYTITWSRNGARVRQLTLVPRVAAWCP